MTTHLQKSELKSKRSMTGFVIRLAFCGVDNTGNSHVTDRPVRGAKICKKCQRIKQMQQKGQDDGRL